LHRLRKLEFLFSAKNSFDFDFTRTFHSETRDTFIIIQVAAYWRRYQSDEEKP
jgi:hypothetical protein